MSKLLVSPKRLNGVPHLKEWIICCNNLIISLKAVYDWVFMMLYNSVYTVLPVLLTGSLDQDLPAATILSNPSLYSRIGKEGCVFSYLNISLLLLSSAAEAFVLVFAVLGNFSFHPSATMPSTPRQLCHPPIGTFLHFLSLFDID